MAEDVQLSFGGKFDDLKKSLDDMGQYIKTWGSVIGGLQIGELVIKGLEKLKEEFSELVHAGSEMIENETNLKSVMNATGQAAGFNLEQMKRLADQMQSTSKYSKEMVISSEAIASTFTNVRGDEFERLIKLSGDLAQVMGGDLSSTVWMFGKALDSPTQGMMLLQRQGIRLSESQKDLIQSLTESGDILGAQKIILDKVQEKYGGAAKAAHDAAGGGLTEMWNVFKEIYETVGALIVRALDPFARKAVEAAGALRDLLGWFDEEYGERIRASLGGAITSVTDVIKEATDIWQEYFGTSSDLFIEVFGDSFSIVTGLFSILEETAVAAFEDIVTVVQTVAGAIKDEFNAVYGAIDAMLGDVDSSVADVMNDVWQSVKDAFGMIRLFVLGVLTGIEVSFKNIPLVAEIAWTDVALGAVTTFEVMKKFLTEDIPEYVRWFFDNWRDVFKDLYNFTTTLFSNLWKNVENFFQNIWAWLKGDRTHFEWTALTTGFESSLKELPKIAERQLGPLEKGLQQRMGELTQKYGTAFADQYKKNLETLGLDEKGHAIHAGERDANTTAEKDEKKEGAKKDPGARQDYSKSSSGAQFEELAALFKRIQQSTAGLNPDQQRAEKQLSATQEARDHTLRAANAGERTAAAVEKIASNKGQVAILG